MHRYLKPKTDKEIEDALATVPYEKLVFIYWGMENIYKSKHMGRFETKLHKEIRRRKAIMPSVECIPLSDLKNTTELYRGTACGSCSPLDEAKEDGNAFGI